MYYAGEKLVNYQQKKGKGKLPLFCGNGERVIPIYDTHKWHKIDWKVILITTISFYNSLLITGLINVSGMG